MEPQFEEQLASHSNVTSESAEHSNDQRAAITVPDIFRALQRQAGNRAVSRAVDDGESEATMVRRAIEGGGGAPLDRSIRTPLEKKMGHDFSDVKVHTGGEADVSARALSANAYTVGNDIVFRSGQFAPEQPSGLRTLAHELTHVVQQRSGPVDGTPMGDGMQISSPSDPYEQEAEATGERVAAGGGIDSLQRDEMEDEELQAEHVQRDEMEEEELQAEHVQRDEMEEEELQAEHVQRDEMEEEEMQM